MQASLDEQDYQVITNEVLRRIKECYNLVPKQTSQVDDWTGIQQFTDQLPIKKDKEWVRMFLLTLPVFKNWVINLNARFRLLCSCLVMKVCRQRPGFMHLQRLK